MGIHGLTGFIDNNQHLLHHHELHDCSVVLDGNNVLHFLYYACHVQCSFGGDYNVYRRKLISTFESFRICGVTPYVIMDGGYTVDGRKLKTSLSRASARIRLIDVMANNQRGQALPALAYETFMQTLSELGIHHATCQFEADNEIAVLANKLQCPVISNDSDFYIFDLSNGFLPLDYLDFRPLQKHNSDGSTSYHYLHCHKYHVDDFINSFDGLNRLVLPVFASLLGNDFINASAFSTFYSRAKVPKIVSKKYSLPPRMTKVISVLHWLHTQNDSTEFSDIKNELLGFIKPRRKEVVERLFVSSVNGYVDVDNFQGFDLFHFLTKDRDSFQLSSAADFCSYGGKHFPDWFTKAVCCGEITPSILNCAILHRVILLTQVEDLSQMSSFACSLGLRRIIYGILLQEQCPATVSKCTKLADTDKMSYACVLEDSNIGYEDSSGGKSSSQKTILSDVLRPEDDGSENVNNTDNVGEREDEFVDEDSPEIKVCEEDMLVRGLHADGRKKVKDSCVEEYTRINKNLLKSLVEPLFIVGEVSVPTLTSLATMSLGDRKSVLTASFGVDQDFLNKFSKDLRLFAACLVVWSRNANPKITLGHLESVIVGVIIIRALSSLVERKGEMNGVDGRKGDVKGIDKSSDGMKEESDSGMLRKNGKLKEEDDSGLTKGTDEQDGPYDVDASTQASLSEALEKSLEVGDVERAGEKIKSDAIDKEINIAAICCEASTNDLENVRQNLHKYHTKFPTFNHKNHFNPRVSHAFAQMQACMVDAINLNKLLRLPFPNLRPSDLINGTFLYNFYVDISMRANADLFISTMLGRNTDVYLMFRQFRDLVFHYAGADHFSSPSSLTTKTRKRQPKDKNKEKPLAETRVDKSDRHEDSVKTVSGFHVANMFSALSLED